MKLSNTMMMDGKLLPSSKKAFTLAEVLITLSILGVVAALTIPSLVNRQSDLAAQVKLKKAISNYEDFAGTYMAEHEAADLTDLSCSDLKNYFKVVTSTNSDCDFVTADGVAWSFQQSNGKLTGSATVTDNKEAGSARYQVALWTKNNRANSDGKSDNVTNAPDSLYTTVYSGSGLTDTSRKITSAALFLQGSGSDASGKLYCTSSATLGVDSNGYVGCGKTTTTNTTGGTTGGN